MTAIPNCNSKATFTSSWLLWTSVLAFALAAPWEIAAGAAFSISRAKRVAMSAVGSLYIKGAVYIFVTFCFFLLAHHKAMEYSVSG